MRNFAVVLCLAVYLSSLHAAERWNFSEKIAITDSSDSVFHHLEGAGRKHIAVSGGTVAAIWEDNRLSDPQVFIAVKSPYQKKFSQALQLSSGLEAYEPSIAALKEDQFAAAWEQDASVYVTVLDKNGHHLNKPVKLSSDTAGHVSITALENELMAVWREQQGRNWSLWYARLQLQDGQLKILSSNRVEGQALQTPVLYPSISASSVGVCIAWEDRRAGNTRLLFSHSKDKGLSFSEPEYLNEFQSNRNVYDKGSGVTRVSIHSFGEDEVLAAWMDKRRSNTGYGIFAAMGSDGGESFGPNEQVHGKKGDKQPHYNPATAGNMVGDFVLAWDDFRLGDSDIWLSTYDDNGEWAENFAPAVASGTAEQSHASIVLDQQGGLHMIWIERADTLSPTRLWYSYASAH